MQKLIILLLFIFPFLVGCSVSEDEEKEAFMKVCTIGGNSVEFIEYCECCYSYYKKHGDGSAYMNAITDNCMSLLWKDN